MSTEVLMRPNPFTERVHELEDKYRQGESTSFNNVPMDTAEFSEFKEFRKTYFQRHARKIPVDDRRKWSKSSEYHEAVTKFFASFDTTQYTTRQIWERINDDPTVTRGGDFILSMTSVQYLMKVNDIPYKRIQPPKRHKAKDADSSC